MPRIARVVMPNYPHHVTQRGTNKAEIFTDDEDRKMFLQWLKHWTNKTNTKILAYCLMDNHFHLLLLPEKEDGLGKTLHGATFRYAQYFNQKHNRSGRLWQNRYFSCPIDKDEYLWQAARYVEENPVRAGLVEKAEDWEWSSAKANAERVGDSILSLADWLDEREWEQYRRFRQKTGKEAEIRRATSTGRPLGNRDFHQKVQERLGRDLSPKKGGRPRKPIENQ